MATENRVHWAGLSTEDFELITTYENSSYCKPNPKYYLELLEKLGLLPEECIMVGNDFDEDILTTEKIGMKGFLLTDCLLNRENKDTSNYPQGNFEDLKTFLKEVLS